MSVVPTPRKRQKIEVQPRDVELLRGLLECRLMTLAHAAVFHFGGKIEVAAKRVQKLKGAGLVGERPRRPYEPSILFLTRSGFELLTERGVPGAVPPLSWTCLERRLRVSNATLRHELGVLDVRAAIISAVAADARYDVVEFGVWPRPFQFRASPGIGRPDVTLRPDGLVRIGEREPDGGRSEHTFYLEVDRSTEVVDTVIRKVACYADHFRRGGLAVQFGHPPEAYRAFPFRVLLVCLTAERRNSLTERLLQARPPVAGLVRLATTGALTADPLGPVWVDPRDYGQVIEVESCGVPTRAAVAHRRRPERDALVEQTVPKHLLLADDVAYKGAVDSA